MQHKRRADPGSAAANTDAPTKRPGPFLSPLAAGAPVAALSQPTSTHHASGSSKQPRFAFIIDGSDRTTPKPSFKPGAFEFSLPQQAKIGKHGAQIQQYARPGDQYQFRAGHEKSKNMKLLMTPNAMPPMAQTGSYSLKQNMARLVLGGVPREGAPSSRRKQSERQQVGAYLSPLQVQPGYVDGDRMYSTQQSRRAALGGRKNPRSPRELDAERTRMHYRHLLELSNSSQVKQTPHELTDDSIFEQYQSRAQPRPQPSPRPHIRALSKESKRMKTPSNVSTQMSRDETLHQERYAAAQRQGASVSWGLHIRDPLLGQTQMSHGLDALKKTSATQLANLRISTDARQQARGSPRGKTHHSKFRNKILPGHAQSKHRVEHLKPETHQSHRRRNQAQMFQNQLLRQQPGPVGLSTRMSFPKDRTDLVQVSERAGTVNKSLQSHQKMKEQQLRSFMEFTTREQASNSIERGTYPSTVNTVMETNRQDISIRPTEEVRDLGSNGKGSGKQTKFFDKRGSARSSQVGGNALSLRSTFKSCLPTPTVRMSTNATKLASQRPPKIKNLPEQKRLGTAEFDTRHALRPMLATAMGGGPARSGGKYSSFTSPLTCNYQQIVSDFNGMLLSCDCSGHQLGNFLNVRRPANQPQKAASKSQSKVAVSKRVFIGELNELQFRSTIVREARPRSPERSPLNSAAGNAGPPNDQGQAAKANEPAELAKPVNMSNPIMSKLRAGLKNMLDASASGASAGGPQARRGTAGSMANQMTRQDKQAKALDRHGARRASRSSSEDSRNPLEQNHDPQTQMRNHEILGTSSHLEGSVEMRRSLAYDEDDWRSQASPWTKQLNLDLLNKDADFPSDGQDLKLFLDKVNFLYKYEPPQKEKGLTLASLKMMFSQAPGLKKMRKLTLEEMHDQIKEKSKRVRDEAYVRVCHLVQLHQKDRIQLVEPLKDIAVDLAPISALFLKLNVAGRRPPLVAMFQNTTEEEEHERGQNANADRKRADVQVYWSYTNAFPCSGQAEENDGGFRQQKVMQIGAQGDRFPRQHVYVAIYARTTSFKDTLMYYFGDRATTTIEHRFRLKSEGAAVSTKTTHAQGTDKKESRTCNTRQKLMKFQQDTHETVNNMMRDDEQWTAFQSKLTSIKNERQSSLKSKRGGSLTEKEDTHVAKDQDARMPPITSRSASEESQEAEARGGLKAAQPTGQLELHLSQRRARKEIQAKQIKRIELERYKYNIFLTMKHDILKKIKDEKLDELVAVLRERKFARLHVIHCTLNKILANAWNGLRVGRIKLLQRNKVMLSVLRVFMSFRRFIKKKYGAANSGPENRNERIRQGFLRTALNMGAMTLHELQVTKAEQTLYHFLRARQKLYWGFTVRQRRVMEKFDAIRQMMKKKISIFRNGMILIIQEIEDSYQQVRQRIRMMKTPQREHFEWLMDELKPVSGLVSAALNLVPKTFSETPQMPAGFVDEAEPAEKKPPEQQNQVYRVALQLFRYIQSRHTLDHFKWYVQQKCREPKVAGGGDEDDSAGDSMAQAKTFRVQFLMRFLEYDRAYAADFLDEPLYQSQLASYPTQLGDGLSPAKMRKKRASRKERSPGLRQEAELEAAQARASEEGSAEGQPAMQAVATALIRRKTAKEKRKQTGAGDAYEREKFIQCDEEMVDRYFEEFGVPRRAIVGEPLFKLQEIIQRCNKNCADLLQQRDQSPSPTREVEEGAESPTPEDDPLRVLRGLNSLELLYKVLIHYKADKLNEIEEEKARRLAEQQSGQPTPAGNS